jgi:hypothetical protein
MLDSFQDLTALSTSAWQVSVDDWAKLGSAFAGQLDDYVTKVQDVVDNRCWAGAAADAARAHVSQTHDRLEAVRNYFEIVNAALPVTASVYQAARDIVQQVIDMSLPPLLGPIQVDGAGDVDPGAFSAFDWYHPTVIEAMDAQYMIYQARLMATIADNGVDPILANTAARFDGNDQPNFLAQSRTDLTQARASIQALLTRLQPYPKQSGQVPPDTDAQPYACQSPSLQDRVNYQTMQDGGMNYFGLKGWSNAQRLLGAWLGNSGSWVAVDPREMMSAMPTFGQTVNDALTGADENGLYDTGWQNYSPGDNLESDDWYYALNDFRYRVVGVLYPAPGGGMANAYTVGVKKPYVFGHYDMVGGKVVGTRNDIHELFFTMRQDNLMALHNSGLAQNFVAQGTAHFANTFE